MTQYDETYGARARRERQQAKVLFVVVLSLSGLGLACLYFMLREAGAL